MNREPLDPDKHDDDEHGAEAIGAGAGAGLGDKTEEGVEEEEEVDETVVPTDDNVYSDRQTFPGNKVDPDGQQSR